MDEVKTVIITGASSGIGKATALHLAKRGYRLALAARGEVALRSVAAECEAEGAEVLAVKADVTRRDDVEKLAAETLERFGGFDVWINNAGIIYYGAFDDIPPEEFRQVIETNLFGSVFGCQAALRYFKSRGNGMIINIDSGFGVFPAPYASPYVASKFAVRGLSATIRQELRSEGYNGIRLCTVLPSAIDTPIYHEAANRTGKKVLALQPVYPVDMAADVIVGLIDNPRDEVAVGAAGRLAMTLYQVWPWAGERIMERYVLRFGYKDVSEPPTAGNLFASLSQGNTGGRWPTWQHEAVKWIGLSVGALALAGLAAHALHRDKEVSDE